MNFSIYTSALFLDLTHDCSTSCTPPAQGPLDLLCICLLSFTVSFNSSSESDVTAIRIKQISYPAWETSGYTQYSSCDVVQSVPRRYGPSPHTVCEGPCSPLGHQGEHNSKTCCPNFLLYFFPTQLDLILSLSCCLDSPCLFIMFFGVCLPWNAQKQVRTQNNHSATAPPTRYWHGHHPLAAISTGRPKQMSI